MFSLSFLVPCWKLRSSSRQIAFKAGCSSGGATRLAVRLKSWSQMWGARIKTGDRLYAWLGFRCFTPFLPCELPSVGRCRCCMQTRFLAVLWWTDSRKMKRVQKVWFAVSCQHCRSWVNAWRHLRKLAFLDYTFITDCHFRHNHNISVRSGF